MWPTLLLTACHSPESEKMACIIAHAHTATTARVNDPAQWKIPPWLSHDRVHLVHGPFDLISPPLYNPCEWAAHQRKGEPCKDSGSSC
jgi:hypothetical protein